MTSTAQRLAEIEAQEKELAVEKAKLLAESKVKDLDTVRRLCKLHGLTAKVKATGKVAAKYRDAETGKEWSGRGLAPKWLQGKDKSQYLIA